MAGAEDDIEARPPLARPKTGVGYSGPRTEVISHEDDDDNELMLREARASIAEREARGGVLRSFSMRAPDIIGFIRRPTTDRAATTAPGGAAAAGGAPVDIELSAAGSRSASGPSIDVVSEDSPSGGSGGLSPSEPMSPTAAATAAAAADDAELGVTIAIEAPKFEQASPEEVSERIKLLTESFQVFDVDKGGGISMTEFQRIVKIVGLKVKPEVIENVAATMGFDGDEISLSGFLGCMDRFVQNGAWQPELDVHLLKHRYPNELTLIQAVYTAIEDGEIVRIKRAFNQCDDDGSGHIDFAEFTEVMEKLGEGHRSPEAFRTMFDSIDRDGSGEIDFEEFVSFMANRGRRNSMDAFFDVDSLDAMGSWFVEKEVSAEETAQAIAKMPLLERLGANYLKQKHKTSHVTQTGSKDVTEDHQRELKANDRNVHVLDRNDRRGIKQLERATLRWDAFFGAMSAIVAGLGEWIAQANWYVEGITWDENFVCGAYCDSNRLDLAMANDCTGPRACDSAEAPILADAFGTTGSFVKNEDDLHAYIVYFWLVVGISTGIITVFEIFGIYYVHLRCAMGVSRLAGLKLWPMDEERSFVTAALARSALELPNPTNASFGVNPLEEASKWKILLAGIVYKAKVGLSTFVLRMLLKRVLSRAAMKSYLSFVGVPVNMVWDLLIGYKCIRAARVVALGPSAAIQMTDGLLRMRRTRGHASLHRTAKEACVRAIASVIVLQAEMHPNLNILLRHVKKRTGSKNTIDHPGNMRMFIESLQMVPIKEDQLFVMQIFVLALILEGWVSKKQVTLFRHAVSRVSDIELYEDNIFPLRRLTDLFIRGEMHASDLERFFDPEDQKLYQGNLRMRARLVLERCLICMSC